MENQSVGLPEEASVREVCRDEKRNRYQDDRVKNGPMNDDLCWAAAVSIDVGRCSGLFRTDI